MEVGQCQIIYAGQPTLALVLLLSCLTDLHPPHSSPKSAVVSIPAVITGIHTPVSPYQFTAAANIDFLIKSGNLSNQSLLVCYKFHLTT